MSESKTQPLIVSPADCIDEMLLDWEKGKEKGSTTHIPDLDQCWKWRKKEFNIWTGYTNEGKSLFLRYLSIIKSLKDNWKFIFCAPEDFPPKEFFDDMVHTICGASTDRDSYRQVSREAYLEAYEMMKENFLFLYLKPPDNSIREVLIHFEEILARFPASVCVIDPLIKFSRPKEIGERDDLYAAYITSICTDFCRKADVSLNLVMHQLTPRLTESGFYPKPTLYNIKGGGTWADGTDNILSIWRPQYAKDKLNDEVLFSSQKIKKQKLVGIPQDFSMRFNRQTNRYVHHDSKEDLCRFPAFENLHKTLNIGGANS